MSGSFSSKFEEALKGDAEPFFFPFSLHTVSWNIDGMAGTLAALLNLKEGYIWGQQISSMDGIHVFENFMQHLHEC